MKKSKTKKRQTKPVARKPCVSRDAKITFCGRVVNAQHAALTVQGVARGSEICAVCFEVSAVIRCDCDKDTVDASEYRDAEHVFSMAVPG